jgi:outer membrane immunogenic protein
MKRTVLAFISTLAAIGSAFAADLPPAPAPMPRAPAVYVPVVAPYNWGGIYVGINGGGALADSSWSDPVFGNTGNFSVNGGMVGATLGFNYQISQFVIGLEGDGDWANLKGTSFSAAATCGVGCTTESDWLATIRARGGFAVDRFLIFTTGGAAFGDIKAAAGALPWSTTTQTGWTAGAGVEYAFTDFLTAKVEYLYVDLGSASCGTANCAGSTTTVKLDENVIRAGVNFKFNPF